jgi:hypothetical protein
VEGLFAYPCRRVATPAYPLGAKIRKNLPRCSPTGGFLCSFNTITPKSPHFRGILILSASLLGVENFKDNVKLMKGRMEIGGVVQLPSNSGYRISLNLFSTEGHGAVIATMWGTSQVIASTTGFDSEFSISLNSSAGKWELTNNSGNKKAYALMSLYYY